MSSLYWRFVDDLDWEMEPKCSSLRWKQGCCFWYVYSTQTRVHLENLCRVFKIHFGVACVMKLMCDAVIVSITDSFRTPTLVFWVNSLFIYIFYVAKHYGNELTLTCAIPILKYIFCDFALVCFVQFSFIINIKFLPYILLVMP